MCKKRLTISIILFIFIFFSTYCFAADEKTTTESYRVKPLQDKLATFTKEDIDRSASKFTDMKTHWSRQVVGKLTGLDIIGGVNGKFLPDASVQADQFIKMVVRALGYKIEQGKGYWAQPYIDTALKEGIILKGEIKDYKKSLLREQAARIIVRTALKVDAKPDAKYDQYIIGKVKDYNTITDGIKQFILDSYKLGLITGVNNKFNPKGTMTRAEASAVIIRFLDLSERKPMKPGTNEIIRMLDNDGNMIEYYPTSIPEYFTVAKAMKDALPKAKGYVTYGYNTFSGNIIAGFYEDEKAYKENPIHPIGLFDIVPKSKYYDLSVNDDAAYKSLFSDYVHEIFKTLYGRDSNKAIVLHDKFMNMKYTRTDGLNDYEVKTLNNRNTTCIRFNSYTFRIQIKLLGTK